MWNAFSSLRLSGDLRFSLIAILGILFCVIGSAGIILSVVELFYGRPSIAHYDESNGGLKLENPLWPSAGKGFWVGLVLIATGLVGLLASRECTPPSVNGFTILSSVSTILSLYLIMTCVIPVQYDVRYPDAQGSQWQTTELATNSLLIAVGGFGSIVGAISTVLGIYLSGYCADQRTEYPYSDDPQMIRKVLPDILRYGTPLIPPRRIRPQQPFFGEV